MSLPQRPGVLAGREELLAEVHALLADGDQPSPRLVVLCGLGGVGKTSLAAEYAYRHLAEVGVAWQLAAEEPAVLAVEMAELAAQLGGRDLAVPRDPVASVHAVLAAWPTSWLLVFDNARDEVSVRRFLPPAGRGRVLVTSQSQHWPGRPRVDVPVLEVSVATKFLISRTRDTNEQAAAALAGDLGGLPLALDQSAAYIQAAATTVSGYRALFAERRADMLARGEASGHPAGVSATLSLALQRLEAERPTAAALLRLLACLAAEPVPLRLILESTAPADDMDAGIALAVRPLLGDRLAAADAVAALRQYSLITAAGDGTVLVHRLVQAVTMDLMAADRAALWRQAAAVLIEAATPADTSRPASWPACAALLPHASVVLDLTSDGISDLATYLGASGSYSLARDTFRRIAEAHEAAPDYVPEHPDTLIARANLAFFTGQAGDPAAARDQYAALLPVMEEVLGAEHPDTLTARANLASFAGLAGDPAAARDQYAALLPVIEKILGAEHPDTLTARANLARWTGHAGDPAAARDHYAALLPVIEKISGAEHPDTLTARANLARWTGHAGDPAAARDQYAALLPTMEKILGAEHPDTLTDRANLATFTGLAGDPAAARDQYAALLPVREKVSGAQHPDTLTARVNLAHWRRQIEAAS